MGVSAIIYHPLLTFACGEFHGAPQTLLRLLLSNMLSQFRSSIASTLFVLSVNIYQDSDSLPLSDFDIACHGFCNWIFDQF